ncbi:helix-turn-helix domain-containing protein [Streptomyces sp. NPDC038707]|uniref:helix-turn-helix domain-containing protein n=1 Tax=unclassified Streptomyces TaxID=2593676 RepID=UPI0033F7B6C2
MARWKELPDMHDQRVRQLFVHLRRLKDRSGMSLTSLAARTGYSRSSWERYLNGKALPPRQAVEELARVTGADPTRLLALHEVAEEVWQQRGPEPAATGQETASAGRAGEPDAERGAAVTAAERPPGVRTPVVLGAVVLAALLGTGVGILIGLPLGGDGAAGPAAARSTPSARPSDRTTPGTGPGRYVFTPDRTYPCKVRRTGGGLSAGYSATRTAVLAGPGWDVVEAQCLLRHRRLDPGAVDGVYGQQTIAAVRRLQKRAGLPDDGVVGPHTWQVLRG